VDIDPVSTANIVGRLHINCQSSLLYHVSNNERATNGPRIGGSGGGLLKATMGSTLSLAIFFPSAPMSVLVCFFGVEVATIPHASFAEQLCLKIFLAGNNPEVPRIGVVAIFFLTGPESETNNPAIVESFCVANGVRLHTLLCVV